MENTIDISVGEIVISDCYLEKGTGDVVVIMKEGIFLSTFSTKKHRLKFLFKYTTGKKVYELTPIET